MKLVLTVFILSLATSNFAQEQPTLKQCRADREAWGGQTGEDTDKLSYKEVDRRENELGLCRFVDKANWGDYVSFSAIFEHEKNRRMFKFIDRHGYWKQFLQEDEHGER